MTDIDDAVQKHIRQNQEAADAIEALRKDRLAWQGAYQKLQKEMAQLRSQNSALLHNAESDRALIDQQWRELHDLREQVDEVKKDLDGVSRRALLFQAGLKDVCTMALTARSAGLLTPTEIEELTLLVGLSTSQLAEVR